MAPHPQCVTYTTSEALWNISPDVRKSNTGGKVKELSTIHCILAGLPTSTLNTSVRTGGFSRMVGGATI